MNLYSDNHILYGAIRDICSTVTQKKSLKLLRTHVEIALRELSLDSFEKFENDLYENVFALVYDKSTDNKKGGVLAIRELVNSPSAIPDAKTSKFCEVLSTALGTNSNFELLEMIACAMGYIFRYTPVPLVDVIESELARALEWLQSAEPPRRLAACAVLQQLAENTPTIFFVQCKEFFDLIWSPVRDPKERVRLCAAQAVSACLHDLDKRTYHLQWYCSIYNEVLVGFQAGSVEAVHGSVLVTEELLKYTGDFMLPRYKEVCIAVLTMRDHKSKTIRSSLIKLFPRLSAYCPEAYARFYLDATIDMLVKCMKQEDLKAVSLSTIGKLCKSMGDNLSTRVDELLQLVREALSCGPCKTKRTKIQPEALACVADMVCGLGEPVYNRVLDLLECMLQGGLTPELIDALAVIADNMPAHKEIIHQKLLGEIMSVLSGVQYSPKKSLGGGKSISGVSSDSDSLEFSLSKIWNFFTTDIAADDANLDPSRKNSIRLATPFSCRDYSGSRNSRSSRDTTAGPIQDTRGHLNCDFKLKRKGFAPWVDPETTTGPQDLPQMNIMSSNQATNSAAPINAAALPTPSPAKYALQNGGVASGDVNIIHLNYDPELVLLAMRTLQLLSTPSSGVLLLVHRHILPFLCAQEESVREEAAATAATLVSPMAKDRSIPLRGPSAEALNNVLSRLLEVCVTDTSSVVRMKILRSIKESFDKHLLQDQRITTLFFLVTDECFDIRIASIQLLGLLADKNPSIVSANMRQVLKNLILQLQNGTVERLKEEAALTICAFLRATSLHRIVTPFMSTLITVLPLESDVRLTMAGMEALGELCVVMKTSILNHVTHLLPIIIMNILDGSSQRKQEISVRTLGQLVSSSGLVVTPYLEYPQLLPALLNLLGKSGAINWSLRSEILRTLGLLGAIDPRKYLNIENQLQLAKLPEQRVEGDHLISIRRAAVNEMYLGAEAVLKASMGIHYKITDLSSEVITLKRQDISGGGKSSLVPCDECRIRSGDSADAQVLVRTAVSIHGVDADLAAHELLYELSVMQAQNFPVSIAVPPLTPSHEEFYPRTALAALMNILHDSTLHMHHPSVTQAITFIFQNLGLQCVRYLDKVIPYFLQIVRKCGPGLRESVLDQISQICVFAQYHIAPYIHDIFDVLNELWSDHFDHVLNLAERLNQYAYDEFFPYTPRLLKLILTDIMETPRQEYIYAPRLSAFNASSPPGLSVAVAAPVEISSASPMLSPPQSNSRTSVSPSKQSATHSAAFVMRSMERKLKCLCTVRNVLRPQIDLVVSTLCKFIASLLCELEAFVKKNTGNDKLMKRANSPGLMLVDNSCRLISLVVRTIHIVSIDKVLVDFPNIAGRAVNTMVRALRLARETIDSMPLLPTKVFSDLYTDCDNFFCIVGLQLGSSFLVLDRSIQECYSICNVSSENYNEIVTAIIDGDFQKLQRSNSILPFDDQLLSEPATLTAGVQLMDEQDGFSLDSGPTWNRGQRKSPGVGSVNNFESNGKSMAQGSPPTKHCVNQSQLQKAWNTNQRYQTSDWNAWFKSVLVEMLRESPSPFLQTCSSLAQAHLPLARELFQAAFVSCWTELSEVYQEHIIRSMHVVFYSPTVPPDILLVMLNLAEFMEHDVEALPIEAKVLAELAEKSHAYAKALHYRELEFQSFPNVSSTCFHRLIHINKKLNNFDGAYGILKVAQNLQNSRPDLGIVVKEAWLAKLGRWDEALDMYEKKLLAHPTNAEALVGKSKCLNALGRWEEALHLLQSNAGLTKKSQSSQVLKSTAHKAAVVGARAAWSLNRWDVMDSFVKKLPTGNIDATFMTAVLAVHEGDFEKSDTYIDKTRKFLNQNMTGLLAESYNRAYVDFVMNQQLGELEEIKDHKQLLKVAGLGIHTTSSHDVLFGSDNHSRSASASDLELLSGGGYQATSNAHMANIPSFLSLSGMNTDGGGSPPPQGGGGNQNAPNLNSSAKTALVAEAVTRKSFLIDKWKKRVRGCVSSGRAAITHWQNIMNVRKMLVGQREDVDTWLQFVVICRHGGNLALSQRALGLRIGEDPSIPRFENSSCFVPNFMDLHSTSIDYRIEFEKLRLQWSLGHKEYACEQLELIVQQLGDAINAASSSYAGHVEQQIAKVYLECLLKLGDWKLRLLGPGAVVDLKCRMEVLQLYQQATAVDPLSYRAWHQWGLSAWHAASSASQESTVPRKKFQLYKTSSFGQRPHRRPSMVSYDERTEMFAINSLRGLFRAMSLASGKHCASVMQDMLCILNFWFKYGEHSNIADVLREGLQSVPLDCWLGVLPQLIARIHHVGDVGRALLHDLLSRLGNHHAQALMYPLSVALQSPREDRQRAAQMLVMNLRQHSSQLIDQSVLVSQELVRIAILWDEEWYATIEDASRIFYNEGNIQKMLDLLLPLHDKMAGGSKTNTEAAFLQAYGGELREAHDFLTAYIRHLAARNVPIPTSGGCSVPKEQTAAMAVEKTYLTKAWDIYTIVIRRIHPTLKQITSHNLLNVSPQLVAAQHLDLAIPGTYTLRGDAVRIRGFRQHISIILSKQRPRKIFLLGENGLEYVFLLKGHEDLRQDERAMQLFGLVNALLKHDRRTDSHDLGIQRYAVVPLSPNVGLSGWVPKCDTLHDLIRNYRERKKIYLDIEHRLMEQLVRLKGSHDKLTTIQKLEVFEHSLKNTNGKDIHNILWHQATSSESWIIRREAYTKSLAVMSVVGYVLGLGDRHPSNLMLERDSCKILHIDFGDCFEVAMHRDKFPEKIPFRLTRMLVLGMEVAGVEGLFRLTCERVMKVMRENCDSLVAILEAFVHDPLLSWRLLNPNRGKASRGPEASQRNKKASTNKKNTSNDNTNSSGSSNCVSSDAMAALSNAPPPLPHSNKGTDGHMSDLEMDHSRSGSTVSINPSSSSSISFAVPKPISVSFAPSNVVASSQLSRSLVNAPPPLEGINPTTLQGDGNVSASLRMSASNAHPRSVSGSTSTAVMTLFNDQDGLPGSGSGGIISKSRGDPVELLRSNEYKGDIARLLADEDDGVIFDVKPMSTHKASRNDSPNGRVGISLCGGSDSSATSESGNSTDVLNDKTSESIANSKTMAFTSRSNHTSTFSMAQADGLEDFQQEELTDKAVTVVQRVLDKLTGLDFQEKKRKQGKALAIPEQVDLLIKQATSNENLSTCFIGWCAFW